MKDYIKPLDQKCYVCYFIFNVLILKLRLNSKSLNSKIKYYKKVFFNNLRSFVWFRYRDVGTPSLSPASYSLDSPRSSVQESPISFQFSSGDSPSTAELSEFLQVIEQ